MRCRNGFREIRILDLCMRVVCVCVCSLWVLRIGDAVFAVFAVLGVPM